MKALFIFILISVSTFAKSQTAIHKGDSLALVDFYNKTIQSTAWTMLPKVDWMKQKRASDWYGVEWGNFNGEKRVISINITGAEVYFLKGTLSPKLGDLEMLQQLSLNFHNFSGGIPEEIGKLKRLKILQLQSCHLTGPVPSNMSNLKALLSININDNELVGNPTNTLGQLDSLQGMYIYSNNFSGEIDPAMSNQKFLKQINLSDNKFSGNPFGVIKKLPVLEQAFLIMNDFSGSLPDDIDLMRNLQALDISKNKFSGHLPVNINNLKRLFYLNIDRNNFEGELPDLNKLSLMRDLNVGHNNFIGNPYEQLKDLKLLTKLDLSDNKELLTRDILQYLISFSALKNLDLDNTNINGSFPYLGEYIYSLEYIDLDSANLIGNIPESVYKLINLQEFHTSGNNLTALPNFTKLPKIQVVSCVDNYLQFDDLLQNKNLSQFIYTPQRNIYQEVTVTLREGAKVNINSKIGGNGNKYMWLHDKVKINDITLINSGDFDIDSLKKINDGEYTTTIYNNYLQQLILHRNPVTINVSSGGEICCELPATLDGNTGNSHTKYLWSTGDTTATISVEKPGQYELTVSVGNDLVATIPYIVSSPWKNQAPKLEEVFEFHNVLFNRSKWDMTSGSEKEVDELIAYMNDHPTIKILIMGHTENRGLQSENLILSQRRCETIKSYMIEHGVSESRIQTKGFGGISPKYSNEYEETRRKNRRVEFKVIEK